MPYRIPAFNDALISDEEAYKTFTWMGDLHKHEFLTWIRGAQSELESRKRIQAAIDMLAGRDVLRRN
jgi:Bacteriocin-protection, YdeI or OmpD-Associated